MLLMVHVSVSSKTKGGFHPQTTSASSSDWTEISYSNAAAYKRGLTSFVRCKEYHMLLLGLWVGIGHPNMQKYLAPLVEQLQILEAGGCSVRNEVGQLINIRAVLVTMVLDQNLFQDQQYYPWSIHSELARVNRDLLSIKIPHGREEPPRSLFNKHKKCGFAGPSWWCTIL